MRALSLTQPWVWLILHAQKCIENRSRNIGNYRGPLALHAAQRMTSEDYFQATCFVAERFGMALADRIPRFDSPELVRGAVLGVCNVVNQCGPGGQWIDSMPLAPRAPSLSVERRLAVQTAIDMRWYMGSHAYLFAGVRELAKPIPCKGALGLWEPPSDVLARLEASR